MPIVTGYEDTPGGHDALVLGAQLTRLTGLGAIVATVYPSDGRGLAGAAARDDAHWLPRARRIALRRFVRAREFIGTGWGHEEPEFIALGPGPVAGVLTDYADEVGAAVLVVGSTGHGLLGRIAPGRTVQRLLPTSRCPVAIAPRGYRHTAEAGILSVAVAYDGSPAADRAVATAVHLAAARARCCGSSRWRRPGRTSPRPGCSRTRAWRRPRWRSTRSPTWLSGRWPACWPTSRSAPTCW